MVRSTIFFGAALAASGIFLIFSATGAITFFLLFISSVGSGAIFGAAFAGLFFAFVWAGVAALRFVDGFYAGFVYGAGAFLLDFARWRVTFML